MVYIKKLVMAGFKSFARRTEIMFDRGINVILGPNGSGKSNISDALCFVLGRLSIKSMRAAKAKNLLFMGSKYVKPAREAFVEMVFDNADSSFAIDKDEVVIKRSVRHNGQSTYKINDEVKTRIEIIEMLAQAGIDPHGFNLVLQGQIQAIVKMHPEDRRKIIEEVAGISIYESRKEKSLHELEKTDEKLKEIGAILRERTAYLRNLDRERTQALRFKELELTIKRAKASIVQKRIEEKQRELDSLDKSIGVKQEQRDKIRLEQEKLQQAIQELSERINQINKSIQQATGIEQETLHNQIANLKAEIEGLKVRKENYEHRKAEIERRIEEMQKSIPSLEQEIQELKTKSPLMAKKAQELRKKKEELAIIEEERKRLLTLKTEMQSLSELMKDKERQLMRTGADSESLLRQLEEYSSMLTHANDEECAKTLKQLKQSIEVKKQSLEQLRTKEHEYQKVISVAEAEMERLASIIKDVQKIDICPLCQSKITHDHVSHVTKEAQGSIKLAELKLHEAKRELQLIDQTRKTLSKELQTTGEKISLLEGELHRHGIIHDKKEQLRSILEHERIIKEELKNLEERAKNLNSKTVDFTKISEQYESKILEIEEISSRTEEDVDTTLLYKEREIEKTRNIIERSKQDLKEISAFVSDIGNNLHRKTHDLEQKEESEKRLNEKFKKMFEERDNLQKKTQESSIEVSEMQSNMRQIDDQINYLRIGKAKLDAEKEASEIEMKDYSDVELIQGSLKAIEERLQKAQEAISQIGSINMRALEIYDQIKKEYDEVQEKVNTLEKEKLEILKIIEEIDTKKRRSFMRTFRAMNEFFTQNFAQLYTKGIAFLELENKEDIFAGGVNIVVKLAKGKFFDVTSLSGGEQTLVALSLLFAIQEYKPYHFYVFDEIDAALDKRNSERLSLLLNQYMRSGQYIVITHNDAIIMNSNVLYGVSMHEGVSKILSLKLSAETKPVVQAEPEQVVSSETKSLQGNELDVDIENPLTTQIDEPLSVLQDTAESSNEEVEISSEEDLRKVQNG